MNSARELADETLDVTRHVLLFDPNVFGQRRVDVIGCGAVGSRIAMEMAKLGISDLHLWDFDHVEPHNIANQVFGVQDIGQSKVEVLARRIREDVGLVPTIHMEKLESTKELGDIVFLAVDTMRSRREIFDTCLHLQFATKLVVEVRMGAEELRVYGFNPCRRDECITWRSSLVDDADTVESACGARTTVGATAGITACLAVHRFLQWYRREVVREENCATPPIEQVMMLRPLMAFTN